MSELNIVEIAIVLVVILVLIVNSKVSKLKKEAKEDRGMLCLLLKDSLKDKMVEMKKGLEDLMNHKKDVKKTRANRKTK